LCLHGCPLGQTLEDGQPREARVFLHHKDGQRVPVAVRITPVHNPQGEVIGAIEIFQDTSHQDQTKSEIELLKQQVYTDSLTGVGNRKYLSLLLTRHLAKQHSINMHFGVIFLDIDRFKNVNDTYGHQVGDQVLISVAKTISGILRDFDGFCRLGGEEFVVIIPNTNQPILSRIAERMRMFIEKTWLNHQGEDLKVTISLGATLSRLEDTPESILARADQLIYQSKQDGRNRVTLD
jgi:diguanylate cyclase (GGDEF)-like protein